MSYEVIYLLKPAYEDLKRGGPGWYKLRWKPIWRHTYFVYTTSWHSYTGWSLGIHYSNNDANNGWNRSYKHRSIRIDLFRVIINIWIRWEFIVHMDGPTDVPIQVPLDLSGLNSRTKSKFNKALNEL